MVCAGKCESKNVSMYTLLQNLYVYFKVHVDINVLFIKTNMILCTDKKRFPETHCGLTVMTSQL